MQRANHHPLGNQTKMRNQEGDKLLVALTEKGILFKRIPKLLEMAGIDVGYGTPEELKKELEKLREEY